MKQNDTALEIITILMHLKLWGRKADSLADSRNHFLAADVYAKSSAYL